MSLEHILELLVARAYESMLPWKILKFRASEITGNAFISINPEKILSNCCHYSVSFFTKNVTGYSSFGLP